MTELDDLELKLRHAERDQARGERDRLKRLIDEIRLTLAGTGSADDKVRWLIDRLDV